MQDIRHGHQVPFDSPPAKFFHARNLPSLKDDKGAWAAILKDISHGEIRPVNLARDGIHICLPGTHRG